MQNKSSKQILFALLIDWKFKSTCDTCASVRHLLFIAQTLSVLLKNVQKFPSTPLKVPVLLLFHFREPPSPLFTSPMSLSAAHFLYRWFHPTSRTLAFFPFPPVKQSLSVLLPDLILSNVRELVASQESHGRQLHSEVGHMVRWVTRAQRSQPRDSLSEGINTPHTNMKESPYFKNW